LIYMADSALHIKKLGRYDITRVIGKGAMGVVYEARDPNLNRVVAIKTVRVDSLSRDDAIDYELRFRTEAHSAARLQHPNIVSVYDADREGITQYLVMEYVKGEDLKHHLDAGHRYTLEQSVRMVRDLLSALEYAHQRKIIHRDIKPANMLIEPDGRLKLTDFGVARIQDSGEVTRTQGGRVGTLKYMSPEQVEGRAVDASKANSSLASTSTAATSTASSAITTTISNAAPVVASPPRPGASTAKQLRQAHRLAASRARASSASSAAAHANHTPESAPLDNSHDTSVPSTPAKQNNDNHPDKKTTPAGPKEACSGKYLFAYGSCLYEQCAKPVFVNHPYCIELKDRQERSRQK
jgi:serine/threonine protein kinase